jgi:hypothetical protein
MLHMERSPAALRFCCSPRFGRSPEMPERGCRPPMQHRSINNISVPVGGKRILCAGKQVASKQGLTVRAEPCDCAGAVLHTQSGHSVCVTEYGVLTFLLACLFLGSPAVPQEAGRLGTDELASQQPPEKEETS